MSPLYWGFIGALYGIVALQYGLLWHWGRPPYTARFRFTRFRTVAQARWGIAALVLTLVTVLALSILVLAGTIDSSWSIFVFLAALFVGPNSRSATQVVFRSDGLRIQLGRWRYDGVYLYFADDVVCINRVSDSSELAKIPYRVLPDARARELAAELGIRVT